MSSQSTKDKLTEKLGKFANSRFVRAIMGAGYSIIAFTIVGSMFLILTVLTQVITIPAFVDFYNNTLGRFSNLYSVIYSATMGIIAIFFAGSFAYNYASIYAKEEKISLDPLNATFLTIMGLFITVPQMIWKNGIVDFVTSMKKGAVIANGYGVGGTGLNRIGATGIFTGLIVAWVSVQLYRICVKRHWTIKMPASVPAGVSNSFASLIPGFIIALTVTVINLILILCGTDIFQALYIPFQFVSNIADTWWGLLIIIFLIHGLWWFGIHGATIISSFYSAIVLSNMASNANGGFHIFAGEFMNAFVTMGGSGAMLGVAIYLAFASRSKQLRELGKVEIIPAIFNINEPLLFGLPIVYNINLLVPFILAPMAAGIIGYVGIATHLVPKIIVQQPWPTPIGLGGMIATASWQGAVLSIVCALASFLVWLPFIRRFDTQLYKKEVADTKEA